MSGGDTPHPGTFIASIPGLARAAGLDPESIIVTTDVGQHQMWTAQFYPVTRTRQLLTSGSLGTMGFGLPAAIGAALANPGKRVICISGDGSIMMNIQELATLAEENLDVTVIVLDNGVLGMVRQQQELLFSKNYSACIYGRTPDLVKIAEGFGISACDAEGSEWYRTAFGGTGPRFVRCRISRDLNVYPFVPAGRANIEALTGV
jgi:acetolactate synthase-1/2/3 large subunit